jgi:Homoserine dehydrogenase
VTPAFVPVDHPFARPRGAENVVCVRGRGCGMLIFGGAGAGGDATASAVVADILAALERRGRGPTAPEGPDLVARPLRAPVLVRFAEGGAALTTDPVAFDRPEDATRGLRGTVCSVIPVWSEVA